MIEKKKIQIRKTARYFQLGKLGPAVREVWFICHGYGQLASYFLRHFEPIAAEDILLIGCEGQHRFYLQGASGRVGASWMTKEERLDDIDNYIEYLDSIFLEVKGALSPEVKICAFGFSQGAATVCRWLAGGCTQIDRLILWAGAFPPDIDLGLQEEKFRKTRITLVVGDADELVPASSRDLLQAQFTEAGLDFDRISFAGGHELHAETLRRLIRP
jgi:predicted esterase